MVVAKSGAAKSYQRPMAGFEMKNWRHIYVFCLLSLAGAYGQMTVISSSPKDPELKPEQRTATIVHYEKVRFTARRTIGMLALALQNTEGSKVRLNEAINNEQDIVDSANWCIQELRDKTADAVTCAFPSRMGDGAGQEGVCQIAQNSLVQSRCAQQSMTAKRIETND